MFASPRVTRNGAVAESLLTVAFVLQLISAIVILLVTVGVGLGAALLSSSSVFGFSFRGAGFVEFGLVIGVLSLVLLIVAYAKSYLPARRADYQDAQIATLILGILFVVLVVTVVIGVLYLFAYTRLSDAVSEAQQAPDGSGAPSTLDPTQRWIRCVQCGEHVHWPWSTCPKCGAKLGE